MQNLSYENQSGSFQFSYKKINGIMTMPKNHSHDSFEVYYLISGKRNYFVKDKIYTIHKGDLIFINIYDLHRTTDAGADYERFLINFKPSFIMSCDKNRHDNIIAPYTKDVSVLRLSIKEQAFIEEILFKMHHEVQKEAIGFEEMILSFLLQLLIFSNRSIDSNPGPLTQVLNPVHERVSLMIQYINQQYTEPLTLSIISDHFYISPYYFCKLFKEGTGFTFIEYLNTLRVKEAQRLLRESKFNVMAISEKVGYGTISHFSRVFKELSGVSPQNYRKVLH